MSQRSKPFWGATGSLSTTIAAIKLPKDFRELKIYVDTLSYGGLGAAYTPPTASTTNGVITLSEFGSPTGGSVTAKLFDGQDDATTFAIAYNAAASAIKTSLTGTGFFASGDITAGGGALNSAPVTLTFTGVWAAETPRLVIVANNLTGGSNPDVKATVTTLPVGKGGYAYLAAGAQEVWTSDPEGDRRNERFLYLGALSGTGNFYVSAYR